MKPKTLYQIGILTSALVFNSYCAKQVEKYDLGSGRQISIENVDAANPVPKHLYFESGDSGVFHRLVKVSTSDGKNYSFETDGNFNVYRAYYHLKGKEKEKIPIAEGQLILDDFRKDLEEIISSTKETF